MKNFPKFIECGAKIFSALYENFPGPVDVRLSDITKREQDGPALALGTAQWLSDNGYICAVVGVDCYENVRLTKQGLNFLQQRCGMGELTMEDFRKAMRSFVE